MEALLSFIQENLILVIAATVAVILIIVCCAVAAGKKKKQTAKQASAAKPDSMAEKQTKPEIEQPAAKEAPSIQSAQEIKPEPVEADTEYIAEAPSAMDESDHEDFVIETEEAPEKEQSEAEKEKRRQPDRYYVTYDKENKSWIIKKNNNVRITRRVKTKKEAMEIVKTLCKNQELTLSVQKKNGKFQKQK